MAEKVDANEALHARREQEQTSKDQRYVAAIEGMFALLEELGGEEMFERAFAHVVRTWREKFYAVSAEVIREDDAHICVHRLVGEPCPVEENHAGPIPVGDDASEWVSPVDGNRRIVAQPFELDYATIKELVAYCERYDLEFSIDARRSWKFSGRSLLMELKRRAKP